jgi:NAD(P)-dependent dehydrogenase (short-subunit alcohol dehydrogenase family)
MSPRRLEGKVAIITGAAGGIGCAAARSFSREGALLLLTDADAASARQLAQEHPLAPDRDSRGGRPRRGLPRRRRERVRDGLQARRRRRDKRVTSTRERLERSR